MQKLIDRIDKEILQAPYYKESPRFREAASTIKIISEGLLEKEKEQIIEAYRAGRTDQQSDVFKDIYNRTSEQYYKENFE